MSACRIRRVALLLATRVAQQHAAHVCGVDFDQVVQSQPLVPAALRLRANAATQRRSAPGFGLLSDKTLGKSKSGPKPAEILQLREGGCS